MAQSDLRVSYVGATLINVGSSGMPELHKAPAGCVGGQFKIRSGAGTLCIVGAGSSLAQGYPVGSTEVVNFTGPAQFYFAAASATMVVSMVYCLGSGASLFP